MTDHKENTSSTSALDQPKQTTDHIKDAQPKSTQSTLAPSSPRCVLNTHFMFAPPREGCRPYLPEEVPFGSSGRRNGFEAFLLKDKEMLGDKSA
jgi:hypothetical protein